MKLLTAIALGCLLLAMPSEDETAAKRPIAPIKVETKAADTLQPLEDTQHNFINPLTAMIP